MEMRGNQAKNRERMVQAITAKNNLQNEVNKTEKIVANLQAKADKAISEADQILADQLLVERDAYQVTLTKMQASLASCTESVERVKTAVRREQNRILAKTAQAMEIKAQWKQQQVFAAIDATIASDLEDAIRPVRTEVKAVLDIIRRADTNLQEQALQALQDGNRALARAILTERAALRNALSA